MQLLHLDKIIISENRQRRNFDPTQIWELADSIESKGLMHPPVVREDGTLVAGERRLQAMKYLHESGRKFKYNMDELAQGVIPVTYMEELSEDLLFEAELEENLLRVDLTWQERADAIAKLHALRVKQNPKHTQQETAREVSGQGNLNQTTLVRDKIILAKHLDDPDVAKAKTEKEAIKIVEKKLKHAHRQKIAEAYKNQEIKSRHTFKQGDALELLAELPDEKFSVILTDPPYGMGADTFGDMSSNAHRYNDSKEWLQASIPTITKEFYRVAAAQAHLYLFCDVEHFAFIKGELAAAGWKVWRTPLVWDKGNQGMLPDPNRGPRRTYELIVYAIKGGMETLKVAAPDIIRVTNAREDNDHAAKKPVALYSELLSRSALPGSHVLDAFCGSGPIFPAAQAADCIATGFELDSIVAGQVIQRIEALEE